jgi:hypothetical protein
VVMTTTMMIMMMMVLFLLLLAMIISKIYNCCHRAYRITNSTISTSMFQIVVVRGCKCTARNITYYGIKVIILT